jgi:hypothetical protein
MGASRDEFTKYPRTPHLLGSQGTSDDKHLGDADSRRFLNDPSLIVEEKIDGTNVGIHFSSEGQLVLQCRGHLITQGMHPQYDLFKQWTNTKLRTLESMLGCEYILFGEWLHARHTIHYRQLPHYFFEFDIFDKRSGEFLSLDRRLGMLSGTGIVTVPVLHRGALTPKQLSRLVGPSKFDSQFDNPETKKWDNIMEGLYLRTESDGMVTGRAKFVRPAFVERIKQSDHWQQQAMVCNELQDGVDIWS